MNARGNKSIVLTNAWFALGILGAGVAIGLGVWKSPSGVIVAISGASTVALVVVTGVYVWLTWQLVRFQRISLQGAQEARASTESRLLANEEKDREERRRLEASKITWWIEYAGEWSTTTQQEHSLYINSEGPGPIEDAEHTFAVLLHIQNDNTTPVFACVVHNRDARENHFIGMLPPGRRIYLEPKVGHGFGSTFNRSLADISEGHPIEHVEFRDQRGIVWRRLRVGTLEEVRKPPESAHMYVY